MVLSAKMEEIMKKTLVLAILALLATTAIATYSHPTLAANPDKDRPPIHVP